MKKSLLISGCLGALLLFSADANAQSELKAPKTTKKVMIVNQQTPQVAKKTVTIEQEATTKLKTKGHMAKKQLLNREFIARDRKELNNNNK